MKSWVGTGGIASSPRAVVGIIGAMLLATGCSSDCEPMVLDDCIETSVSLQQGVYGRVVDQNDVRVGDCPAGIGPWPGNPLSLYVVGSDVRVAEDISDQDGIYELPAAPGDYMVCRSGCVPVTVPMNGRVRVDLALPFVLFTVREAATCAQ